MLEALLVILAFAAVYAFLIWRWAKYRNPSGEHCGRCYYPIETCECGLNFRHDEESY